MTARWEIDVPMTVHGVRYHRPLAANDHWHWRTLAGHAAAIRAGVAWNAKNVGIPHCDHISVGLHYAPGDNRRRDPSNLMATQKPAVDGLVDAGVVEDDDPLHVTEHMPVIHPGRYQRRLWLVVEASRP